MTSEDNGLNPLEDLDSLDHMNKLISSSPGPGLQASTTPPMPPSTWQKHPSLPVSTNSAPGYAHHPGNAPTFRPHLCIRRTVRWPRSSDYLFPSSTTKKRLLNLVLKKDENRDQAFQQELTEMLLDALIETGAWSTARLKHESFAAAEKFEAGISNITEIQRIKAR